MMARRLTPEVDMFLQVGEAALALEDTGSGPPVLLLHGFPSTRRLWGDVIPLLAAAGRRVLAPDLAGYGDSPCGQAIEPDMETQARILISLLDALGIARADIVAHDVGTAAAQIMVARARDRVRGLVLIDGVHGAEWAMTQLADIRAWDPAHAARLHPLLVRRVRMSGSAARLDAEPVRAMMEPYEGENGGRKLIRAARALRPEQTAELGPALRTSGVPALVIWGDHDPYLSVADVGGPLAALLGARLLVLQGGHFLPLERPIEIAAAVNEFLGGLPRV
jgi:pimeloyl-ACP methyl ester carboxylesterase